MRASTLSATAALFLAVPSYALPNDSVTAPADPQDGTEIIVTGRIDGYRTEQTSSATKTNTPLIDVPQAVTVLTRQQIDDQAIRSIADLVRYVPGASAGQGEGNRDQITLRGNNTTADFFVDGLRDDVQYFRSFYNVDRVEVLKGPNAMIFGRGGGGGVVNRVSKGPIIGSTRAVAEIGGDTFGSWAATGDLNVDLGGAAALRVNGVYEALANHRDVYEGARYAINPVIGTELAGGIKLQLGYEHVGDDRVTDRGVPSQTVVPSQKGRPLTGFRDTFFGVPGVNKTYFEANVARVRAEAPLTDRLTVNAQLLYGDYNKSYRNAFPASPVVVNVTTGARTLGVEAYYDLTQRENFIAQGNAEWRGSTGGIDHVVLFGGEYTRQDSGNERRNGFFDLSAPLTAAKRRAREVALSDPFVVPPFTFIAGRDGDSNRQTRSALTQGSVYLQDQISIGDHVDVIAGLRYDRTDLVVNNLFSGERFQRSDDLWSPRFGLVLKPVATASLYGSYTRSYLPQSGDQFLSLTASLAALVPERFDNYELGVKWDVTPALQATLAIYQLDRTNTRASPTPGTIVLTGAQRSKGVELGVTGNVTKRWQTSLGYGYTEAEITGTTLNAARGQRVGQVPRHQFSLWNRYQLLDRLGVGAGLYHQTDQFASISNAVTLPGYTRLDLALFWKLTDRIDAQVNVENVTNERYFPVAQNDVNISTGAPTNARFTLRARF